MVNFFNTFTFILKENINTPSPFSIQLTSVVHVFKDKGNRFMSFPLSYFYKPTECRSSWVTFIFKCVSNLTLNEPTYGFKDSTCERLLSRN